LHNRARAPCVTFKVAPQLHRKFQSKFTRILNLPLGAESNGYQANVNGEHEPGIHSQLTEADKRSPQ